MDILIFVIALSILVIVHEFGHYFAAKFTGVKVEEFGLGLPPMIWGKKIGQTIWSLNWLPIGGFCKLEGESPEDTKKSTTSFMYKNPWQKGLIVLGGVLMNIVLAVVIFSTVYTILGVPTQTNKVKVIGVVKNSPAETAGIKEKDWVLSVNDVYISKPEELTKEVIKDKGNETNLLINRDDQILSFKVMVRDNPPAGEGAMGVAISNTEMTKIAWYEFYKGIGAGFKEAYFWGKIILGGVTKMIGGLLMGKVPSDVAGPIGMFEATSSIKKSQGFLAVIHFFGIVSVNLAVVNVLPFPALDGGRIIFVLYEMFTKKRANQKFEGWVNNIGMMILLTLILAITVGDVARLVKR
ncbi:MAG: site-2 protease family protein [Candidatus Levybacteria bacterium]|nr:site-2 protease family protein [Candidatus Levybacteria bacterium]